MPVLIKSRPDIDFVSEPNASGRRIQFMERRCLNTGYAARKAAREAASSRDREALTVSALAPAKAVERFAGAYPMKMQ